MKRFEFRLERVLNIKKQHDKLALLRQQQARAALDAATAQVAARTEQLGRAAAGVRALLGRDVEAAELAAHYQRSAAIGRLLEADRAREAQAAAAYQQACRERTRIATEVEVIQTLRDRKWGEYRQELQQYLQDQMDEQGMRRWMAARAERDPG